MTQREYDFITHKSAIKQKVISVVMQIETKKPTEL